MRLAGLATLSALSAAAFAHQAAGERQAAFGAVMPADARTPATAMASQYIYDLGAQGPPALSDIIAQEKGSSIAVDAILRSETLVRAVSGDSPDFGDGLTLLLPTNRAFRGLGPLPDDLELVMKRHFIAQVVAPAQMERGVVVPSYDPQTELRFSSSHGSTYVQAGQRRPVEVRCAGTRASNGVYCLADDLFL